MDINDKRIASALHDLSVPAPSSNLDYRIVAAAKQADQTHASLFDKIRRVRNRMRLPEVQFAAMVATVILVIGVGALLDTQRTADTLPSTVNGTDILVDVQFGEEMLNNIDV
tara:strand:+ start:374 stop:709 length:336 start_codon:yes stop_codon:yes gene_type:complete